MLVYQGLNVRILNITQLKRGYNLQQILFQVMLKIRKNGTCQHVPTSVGNVLSVFSVILWNIEVISKSPINCPLGFTQPSRKFRWKDPQYRDNGAGSKSIFLAGTNIRWLFPFFQYVRHILFYWFHHQPQFPQIWCVPKWWSVASFLPRECFGDE